MAAERAGETRGTAGSRAPSLAVAIPRARREGGEGLRARREGGEGLRARREGGEGLRARREGGEGLRACREGGEGLRARREGGEGLRARREGGEGMRDLEDGGQHGLAEPGEELVVGAEVAGRPGPVVEPVPGSAQRQGGKQVAGDDAARPGWVGVGWGGVRGVGECGKDVGGSLC